MKRRKKKLSLNRETLKQLEDREVAPIAGASGNVLVSGCVCTFGCGYSCNCGSNGCGSNGCGGGTGSCPYPDSFCV